MREETNYSRDQQTPPKRGLEDRPVLFGLTIFTLFIVMVIASPILIPIACVLSGRERRRRLAVISATMCERCGTSLEADAAARADAFWLGDMARMRSDHPGMRFRVVRHVFAICGHCGAAYDYDDERPACRLIPPDEFCIRPNAASENPSKDLDAILGRPPPGMAPSPHA